MESKMRIILTDEEYQSFLDILERDPEDNPKLRAFLDKESPFEEADDVRSDVQISGRG